MTTLYYSQGACSIAAHILLEQSGLAFDTVRLSLANGDQRSAAFLEVNPQGRVPALEVDGSVITESLAVLTWIARSAPEQDLIPRDPMAAARVYEKLSFFISSVHIAFAQVWRPERFATDRRQHEPLRREGHQAVARYYDEIERMLDGVDWLVGDDFSAADLYPFVFYRWAWRIDIDPRRYPAWTRHTARMLERPAVQRALAREQLSAKDFLRIG